MVGTRRIPERETETETDPIDLGFLLAKVETHDRKSFELLYDHTCRRMYSLALRMTGSHELTEEVISDLYLQVWQQAIRYDPTRGAPLAWLTVLCRSRALDARRRHQATTGRESVTLDQIPEETVEDRPEDLLELTERRSAVHSALAALDPEQRQLLALAYFRGCSHSELAEQTGLPLGTVKTQIRKCMSLLKAELAGKRQSEGIDHG